MLADARLSFADFDLFEIHEAFAAQTLATLKAWESAEYCREFLGKVVSPNLSEDVSREMDSIVERADKQLR